MIMLLLNLGLALAAEQVLLDDAMPERASARGTFRANGGGVHLSVGAPGYMDVLVPDGPILTDGTTRAVVALAPKRPNLTVLVRTSTTGDLESLNGVGLTLRADRAIWERWDGGVSLPIAPPVRTALPLAGRTVEVEIRTKGDQLSATVRDAGTKAVIVQTSARDGRWLWGRAAIRVQDDGFSAIRRITVDGAALAPDAPRPAGDPGAPLGEDRFVLIAPADAGRLPSALRGKVLGTWPYDDRGMLGLRATVSELDQLRASGVRPQIWPLVPFWALDEDLRKAARKVPMVDGRPDVLASYKDPDMVATILRTWAAAHPELARAFALGRTHQGREIVALRLTAHPRPDEAPAVLLLGGIHGSELLAPDYVLDAVDRLLADPERRDRTLAAIDLWVVPLLNPDGNAVTHQYTQFAGRKNGRDALRDGRIDPFEGVDLNRNFPFGWGRDESASRSFPRSMYYRGPEPGSEPETQALMRLAEQRRFAAALSFHTNGSMLLVPYTLNGVTNPEPNAAMLVAQELVVDVPQQPSGKPLRVRKQMYPVDGTEQDWMRFAHGTLAYTVEGSHHNPTSRATRLASIVALRPLVPTLLDRVALGPRISGKVVDPAGRPIEAAITVSAERLTAGERWTSRPADGRFHRMIAQPGPVQVTARADGYRPATQRLDVRGPVEVTLVLEPAPTRPPTSQR